MLKLLALLQNRKVFNKNLHNLASEDYGILSGNYLDAHGVNAGRGVVRTTNTSNIWSFAIIFNS